jgi:hypothetical protein
MRCNKCVGNNLALKYSKPYKISCNVCDYSIDINNQGYFEYIRNVYNIYNSGDPKSLYYRSGQIYFNELSKINKGFADTIRSTDIDPYYDDSKINEFLSFVSELFDREE